MSEKNRKERKLAFKKKRVEKKERAKKKMMSAKKESKTNILEKCTWMKRKVKKN